MAKRIDAGRCRMPIGVFCALTVLCSFLTVVKGGAEEISTIPMSSLGVTCRVIGMTGKPLGTMVTLRGIAVSESRSKGDPTAPKVQVLRVDGCAARTRVEIPVRPHSTGFGEPYYVPEVFELGHAKPDPERSLPRIEAGETYELWGYEAGRFVGAPKAADDDGGICRQTAGFYFTSEFVVVKCKKVSRAVATPGRKEK